MRSHSWISYFWLESWILRWRNPRRSRDAKSIGSWRLLSYWRQWRRRLRSSTSVVVMKMQKALIPEDNASPASSLLELMKFHRHQNRRRCVRPRDWYSRNPLERRGEREVLRRFRRGCSSHMLEQHPTTSFHFPRQHRGWQFIACQLFVTYIFSLVFKFERDAWCCVSEIAKQRGEEWK